MMGITAYDGTGWDARVWAWWDGRDTHIFFFTVKSLSIPFLGQSPSAFSIGFLVVMASWIPIVASQKDLDLLCTYV
ncbi:hypothetical protein K402DRAFT_396362, partial [Aulographum hederae CBS 113979]